MAFIDSTVVNVALPAIQRNLSGTLIDLQWVVEGYGLLLGALILAGGSMGDLFGRRRMFLVGVTIFATASAACGLARNIEELVMARIAQGLGAAFLVPGSLSIIGASFREEERGRAIGTWSGFTSIATAAGPVLGGWLIEHSSWRWAFFINVPIAAAVIAVSLWRVPESKTAEQKKVDWTGALIVTLALAGVTYGLIQSSSEGWARPTIWGSSALGCAGLIGFVYFEARAKSPMVPLELFRSRDFSGANSLTLFLYAALGIFFFLFPMNLIQVQHYSATATGAAALPLILLMSALSRWSGGLAGKFGARRPLIVGSLIAAAGFVLFAVPSVGGSYWTTFFPAFVVLGMGLAVCVAPLTTVVMEAVNQNDAGTASGVNNAMARVAGLLAIAVFGIAMVRAFSYRLNLDVANLEIASDVMHSLKASETRLAALPIPAGIPASTAVQIKTSINQSFVFGFRVIALICAGLAMISAAVAWRLIGSARKPSEQAIGATGDAKRSAARGRA